MHLEQQRETTENIGQSSGPRSDTSDKLTVSVQFQTAWYFVQKESFVANRAAILATMWWVVHIITSKHCLRWAATGPAVEAGWLVCGDEVLNTTYKEWIS
jgi:hypothetical protein